MILTDSDRLRPVTLNWGAADPTGAIRIIRSAIKINFNMASESGSEFAKHFRVINGSEEPKKV